MQPPEWHQNNSCVPYKIFSLFPRKLFRAPRKDLHCPGEKASCGVLGGRGIMGEKEHEKERGRSPQKAPSPFMKYDLILP
jgi:hypothetical protein